MSAPVRQADRGDAVEPPDGRLAGVVAHQLGQGVAVIDACASRLREADGAPDVVRALEAVGERLRQVDEDLHDLVRIARRHPSPALVHAGDALATACKEFAAANGTRAAVAVNAGTLPSVYADRTQLECLFVHLLQLVANGDASGIEIVSSRAGDDTLFLVADDRAPVDRSDIASLLEEPRPGQRLGSAGASVSLEVCRAILGYHRGRFGTHYGADGRLVAVAFSLPAAPAASSDR